MHTCTRRGENNTPSGAASVTSEGHPAADEGLGAWEKKSTSSATAGATSQEAGAETDAQKESLGLGGTRKSDMKPFQWDTALPKLADRKMLNMLVN
jgi:hypothetical protein